MNRCCGVEHVLQRRAQTVLEVGGHVREGRVALVQRDGQSMFAGHERGVLGGAQPGEAGSGRQAGALDVRSCLLHGSDTRRHLDALQPGYCSDLLGDDAV